MPSPANCPHGTIPADCPECSARPTEALDATLADTRLSVEPPPLPTDDHTLPLSDAAPLAAPDAGSMTLALPDAVDATQRLPEVEPPPPDPDATERMGETVAPAHPSAEAPPTFVETLVHLPSQPGAVAEKAGPPHIDHDTRLGQTLAPEESKRGVTTDFAARGVPTGRPHSPATSGMAAESRVATRIQQRVRPEGQAFPAVPGYEILAELGRGGMGVVYKARHVRLNRLVALKMILAGGRAGKSDLARFQSEAEAVAQLHHPHIVQIYEIGEADHQPYFALEFVEGGTLDGRSSRNPLTARQAARVVEMLAEGMEVAHRRGIVHRDLKPANVLVEGPANAPVEQWTPKITDFGLAKRVEGDSGMTRDGSVMGTPSYMAPEQARGKVKEIGPPADVYALGAILYDLLTGGPPFRGETVMDTLQQVISADPLPPARLHPKLPSDLETICLKCLEKDARRRYPSAGGLAADLRRFLDDKPIEARATPAWERAWKWTRRHPAGASLIAAGILFILFLIGGEGYVARLEAQRADEAERLRKQAENSAEVARSERAVAEEQRRIAEAHFHEAQDAVDTLTQLGHRRLALLPRAEPVRREILRKALEFHRRFLETAGTTPSLQHELGLAHLRLGEIQEMLGDRPEAEKAYHAALDVFNALKTADTDDRAARRHLALAWNDLGILMQAMGRNDEAREGFDRAIDLKKTLAEEEPGNVLYRRELANSFNSRGNLHLAAGHLTEAGGDYEQARALLVKEGDASAASSEVRQALAQTYVNLGAVRTQSNPTGAEDAYGRALPLWEALSQAAPDDPYFVQQIAQCRLNRGTLRQLAGEANAAEDCETAATLMERLVDEYPGVADNRRLLANAYVNWGQLLRNAKQPRKAEVVWRKSIPVLAWLAQHFPGEPEHRQRLGRSYNEQAIALATTGRAAEAEAAWREALPLQEKLVAERPRDAAAWQDLVDSRVNFALLLAALPPSPAAEKACEELVEVQRRRVAAFATEVAFRAQLAQAVGRLGSVRLQLERSAEARTAFADAVREQKAVLAERRQPADRAALEKFAAAEVESLVRAGDHAGAAAAVFGYAGKATGTAPDAPLLPPVQAATFLARCMAAVEKDPKIPATDRNPVVQRYGDDAMGYLRRAVETGKVNPKLFPSAPELRPLYGREDFRKLTGAVTKP
jgi:tetratricopeptide (TPR) repeat protein/tRNA A-37 threonylcarbamoyl transferase component Bud32